MNLYLFYQAFACFLQSEEDEDSGDDSESEEENNKDEIDEAFKNEVKVALGDAAIDEEVNSGLNFCICIVFLVISSLRKMTYCK